MAHETDYQRARRQRQEVKKHGITGADPKEASRNIKKHEMVKKMNEGLKYRQKNAYKRDVYALKHDKAPKVN